jgi:hypothetical protein
VKRESEKGSPCVVIGCSDIMYGRSAAARKLGQSLQLRLMYTATIPLAGRGHRKGALVHYLLLSDKFEAVHVERPNNLVPKDTLHMHGMTLVLCLRLPVSAKPLLS